MSSLAKHNFSVLSGVHYCDIPKGKSSQSYKNINGKSDCSVTCGLVFLGFFLHFLRFDVQIK